MPSQSLSLTGLDHLHQDHHHRHLHNHCLQDHDDDDDHDPTSCYLCMTSWVTVGGVGGPSACTGPTPPLAPEVRLVPTTREKTQPRLNKQQITADRDE